MNLWFSILLITVCAVFWDIGIVLQKKAADEIPKLEVLKHAGKSLGILLHSPKWVTGLAFSALGWGLFLFVLNYTPISLARIIQGSGFVILAVFSLIFLNHRLNIYEWIGVILVTIGIIGLGLSQTQGPAATSRISPERLILVSAVILSIPLSLLVIPRVLQFRIKEVVMYSILSGVLLGFGDIFTKSMLIMLDNRSAILGFLIFLPLLSGFYIFGVLFISKSYQKGRAILVTGISDFSSRIVTLFVGMYALGERLPKEIFLRDLRIGGITVIFIGTFLLSKFTAEKIAEHV